MTFIEIFLTAVSLSLDAVAVAVAAGAINHLSFKNIFKISVFFGGFQMIMPILGLVLGTGFKEYFFQYGSLIGFIALFALGLKMLHESLTKPDTDVVDKEKHITQLKVLFVLAFSTSVDALVIGITYAFVQVNLLVALSTIGIITFILCFLGAYLGSKGRNLFGNKVEIIGALILIVLSFKILLY